MIYQIYKRTPSYKSARMDVSTILSGLELAPPSPFDNEDAKKILYLVL